MTRHRPVRLAAISALALLVPLLGASPSSGNLFPPGSDDAPILITPKGEIADEISEADEQGDFAKLRDAYYETRLLSGDRPLTVEKAAKLRRQAIEASAALPRVRSLAAEETVGGPWTSVGPDPSVQVGRTSNTFQAVSGRIGALAVKQNGDILAGAAQGGVWLYHQSSRTWTSQSTGMDTQAVGAIAIAPSDPQVVYVGTGEGALSGDSYYGDGVYKSTDGGQTWDHVSGDFFAGNSSSDIVVDPANADHVYLATLRGRGGIRRTTPPSSQPYGIWESTDGGASWTLLKGSTDQFRGATDLVMDPLAPRILWASFWGDGIYRSQNGGKSWSNAMGNLPQGQFAAGGTRFSLGIAHLAGQNPVIYTGTDYFDKKGNHHPSSVWRNDSGGLAWTHLPTGGPGSNPDSILDYCGTQCSYDNVVMPDPTNPDIVYVAGSYGYDQSPQSGGIYRSTDGGQSWKSLGYDLHPDFHALAFEPDDTSHVVVGNDGGVWQSADRGGRHAAGAPLSAASWENLNGQVNPANGAFVRATGIRITQFTSIATVPQIANTYWGGTQDNGTQRKSTATTASGLRWFDQPSGDGGQVIVDHDTPNDVFGPGFPGFVFGTYFGISPYRFSPERMPFFAGNQPIDGGINKQDRAEFYIPWVMNRANTNQMFLGTYRLYRTDNAEAPSAGDVHWTPISGDLTTGCPGTAPNGARGCFISAIGVADGGDAVYTGSDDGKVFVNPHAVSGEDPTAGWKDITGPLPNRPVSQFAVDRSNWRIAYISYAGFSAATPTSTGHVFKTTDGGQSWTNITTDLPDVPVNSIVLDPSYAGTLYAGTDVGVYVSTDDGGHWKRLGTNMPKVNAWQLDFDPTRRLLAVGTHGRGAYTITDSTNQAAPALIVSKTDSGKPVGPGKNVDYTISIRNRGNAGATGVTVTDPLPAHTSFSSADQGGTSNGSTVTWSGLTVPAGGTITVHLSVTIDPGTASSVTEIVNDGIVVTAAGGFRTTGSPHSTPIAPAYDVSLTPKAQKGGARPTNHVDYTVHVHNNGFQDDAYTVGATGTWAHEVLDATCTTPVTAPMPVASGESADVCVRVTVPTGVANADTSDTTVTATSGGSPSVSGSASTKTIAVTVDTLLVDNDNKDPDVEAAYKAALTGANEQFSSWDLSEDPTLPMSFLTAHKNVVWFTGNSYPGPILPYEDELSAFLVGGGRLLMSGQDILDQAAGTTDFVHNYLHIAWDGSETQNDKATDTVTSAAGNPVSAGIGTVPIDHTVLGAAFEDQLTPIAPATAEFTGGPATYGLTVADGPYKVSFLGFPLEAYGTAAQKAELVKKTLDWFRTP